MSQTLTTHLGELATTLVDLRRRFRRAARLEVAQAVGEALRELALALICGPARRSPRRDYPAWDDAWAGPEDDAWPEPFPGPVAGPTDDEAPTPGPLNLHAALVAGLAASRWAFARGGQLAPAAVLGILVALTAVVGGPVVEALLGAWAAADDLLREPGAPDRP